MPPQDIATSPPPDGGGKVIFADEQAAAALAARIRLLDRPDPACWQQVKRNASRTVYHGHLGDLGIYLKHFHSRSPVHRVLRGLGRSDAMRELRFARYLTEHGVPTAPPLAAACGNGVEWLATRAVAPAQPADVWHAEQLDRGPEGRRAIRRATVAFGTLIGHMHAAGVLHRDLHCGNILVRVGGPGEGTERELRLVLMDLHRAHRRHRPSRRARAANLAQLFHDRRYFTTRTDRLRFLKHYLASSGAEGTLRGWQLLVAHLGQLHTRRLHRQRDRRIFRRGKYFTALRLAGRWRAVAVRASKRQMAGSRAAQVEFRDEDWRAALADPESLLAGEGVLVVKDSRSSLVVRRKLRVGGHELDVFIKRPRRKHGWKVVLDCLRRGRPTRAFALGHALLARRIATAIPLAALERRVGPVLLDGLLITEAVHASCLDDFLNTWLATPPRGDTPLTVPQQRQIGQDVLWQLGRMLQHLHDNCFAHRDLKAANVLVRWQPLSSPELVLVDLDGLSRCWVLSARRRFQGLMRLNVSLLKCPVVNRAGRLRMLMGYLRRIGSGPVEFKPYWRVLEDWSARKLRQQIRSRRRRQKAVRRPAT